jgi:hypothetical protein
MTNPSHCGDCDTGCPYGVCQDGDCPSTTWGTASLGPDVQNWPINYFIAEPFTILGSDTVVSLGAVTMDAGKPFRMGLYTNTNGRPNNLIVQTGEIISVNDGPAEGLVTPTQLDGDTDYWLVLITPGSSAQNWLQLSTIGDLVEAYYGEYTYGPLPDDAPTTTAVDLEDANLFAVTVPSDG